MTRIPSDVTDAHKIRLKELQEKQGSSSFKKIIQETRSPARRSDDSEEKEEGQGCVISIFELPRHHFDLSDEENVEAGVVSAPPLTGTCTAKALAAGSTVQLPDEIARLFEKMAGEMLVISSSGDNETTLFLNDPEFDHSLFHGTRITIKEFSTAPKVFNIEIATSGAALTQLNLHKSALLTAFAKRDFNFSIGRLETEIQETDRPLFHRKGPVSQDGGDQFQ